jgi:hypothetical protein
MSAYAPEMHVRRPHVSSWLVAVAGLVAVLLAGIGGYAIGGGFATESSPGQDVSDRVTEAWATGDAASIAAAYDPAIKVVLIYDNKEEVIAGNVEELTGAIQGAIGFGNTYTQIGPVSTYEADDGDLYVSSTVEVRGLGHPEGAPLVGFYRVHDGKVVRQIFLDAEHY